MLNALAGAIPARERVITCEEVFELWLVARDWVAMQCAADVPSALGGWMIGPP